MRHGCPILAVTTLICALSPAASAQVQRLGVRAFDIEYYVNDDALPLDSVQLWYTQDDGGTWNEYGLDEDRQSPFPFHAPDEGTFGFFFVMSNTTGASSAAPAEGTPPQQRVLVDFTPPVVQLHPLRTTTSLGQTVVHIRWTAIDTQLTSRPIELAYRRPPDTAWQRIGSDPLANTGRYDWRLPDGISGALAVRVTVSDHGGHSADSEVQVIELPAIAPGPSPVGRGEVAVTGNASPEGRGGTKPSPLAPLPRGEGELALIPGPSPEGRGEIALAGSKRAMERVGKLMGEAAEHRERGEYAQGVARLREAVKLDPQRTEAFAEMAGMLAKLGDYERALGAYEIALKQNPNLRSALQGSALVLKEKNDFQGAGERLRTILRYNPNDAEVWMNLGDVAIFQGDESLARDCYTRATQIDPKATQVISAAQQRLALMTETSRGAKRDSK